MIHFSQFDFIKGNQAFDNNTLWKRVLDIHSEKKNQNKPWWPLWVRKGLRSDPMGMSEICWNKDSFPFINWINIWYPVSFASVSIMSSMKLSHEKCQGSVLFHYNPVLNTQICFIRQRTYRSNTAGIKYKLLFYDNYDTLYWC